MIFHEEDIELGLSSSAPHLLNLIEMTRDEDDFGVEYHRMEDYDESLKSEELMENRGGLFVDGGIDWGSYREAMDLGGQVWNKDTSTSFDKYRLLAGNCKIERVPEQCEDMLDQQIIVRVKNEKITMQEVCDF